MLTKADIQSIKALSKASERRTSGLFVAEGVKLVRDMLGFFACSLLVIDEASSPQWQKQIASLSPEMRPKRTEILPNNFDFSRISGLKTPQPALALLQIPQYNPTDFFSSNTLMLYLDDVQDPGNLGTILRTADWFGVRDVVLSRGSADPFSPKVVQASMGALSRIRATRLAMPSADFLSHYKGEIYGTFLNGTNLYEEDLSTPYNKGQMLVMGNEGNGISPEVEQYVGKRLCIPAHTIEGMATESLNVAVATAICLSELRHPRGGK